MFERFFSSSFLFLFTVSLSFGQSLIVMNDNDSLLIYYSENNNSIKSFSVEDIFACYSKESIQLDDLTEKVLDYLNNDLQNSHKNIDSIVYKLSDVNRFYNVFITKESITDSSSIFFIKTVKRNFSDSVIYNYFIPIKKLKPNLQSNADRIASSEEFSSMYLTDFTPSVLSFFFHSNKLAYILKTISEKKIEVFYYISEIKIDEPYSLSPITEVIFSTDSMYYYSNDIISTDTTLPTEFVYFEKNIDSIIVKKNGINYGIEYHFDANTEFLTLNCLEKKVDVDLEKCYPYTIFRENYCGIHPYYWNVSTWQGMGIRICSDCKILDKISGEFLIGTNTFNIEELALINFDYLISLFIWK